jgi:exonuclease VII large subunit
MADYEMNTIDSYANDIATIVDSRLHHEDMRIYQLGTDIERLATAQISSNEQRIELIKSALHSRLELIFSTEEQRLCEAERALKSYSLDNILRLGFAVARSQEGVIKSVANHSVGESIDIELLDGVMGAEIKSITPKK